MDGLLIGMQQMVRGSDGGVEGVAARIGKRASVLGNELNPHNDNNKLGFELGVALIAQAPPEARAVVLAELGRLWGVDIHEAESGHVEGLERAMLDVMTAGGELARTVGDARADGRITGREQLNIIEAANRMHKEVDDVVRSIGSPDVLQLAARSVA